MAKSKQAPALKASPLREVVRRHSNTLSKQLQAHQTKIFPPLARKTIRNFTPAEVAKFFGLAEGYLRTVVADLETRDDNDFKPVTGPGNRRVYSVDDVAKLRKLLDETTRGARVPRRYVQNRTEGEDLQVIAVMNFKGGSGKTTTAAHLAQYLGLRGYRVLAIDLDPQASLSALFGTQPEVDVGENETIYGAIRYDDERRSMRDVIRKTYIPGLDLIPGNIELMEFEHTTPKALMQKRPNEPIFFARIQTVIEEVGDDYDVVVIDCPPQLGFLTMSALTAATSVLITVHPQMLDVMSMNQFLAMTSDLLDEIASVGADDRNNWMRFLITRFEPTDGPQNQMVALLRSMFNDDVMVNSMLKSTAISDAGLTNQTLFEVERGQFTRTTYDRALESMNNVNAEIEGLIKQVWGRS
ncbi:chromosome partitioning protein [Rhizobium sp. PP-WC-2G-219]|nr:chromosome partitioning protein [Rhizobium sp. PP-WC-2G-219]